MVVLVDLMAQFLQTCFFSSQHSGDEMASVALVLLPVHCECIEYIPTWFYSHHLEALPVYAAGLV